VYNCGKNILIGRESELESRYEADFFNLSSAQFWPHGGKSGRFLHLYGLFCPTKMCAVTWTFPCNATNNSITLGMGLLGIPLVIIAQGFVVGTVLGYVFKESNSHYVRLPPRPDRIYGDLHTWA